MAKKKTTTKTTLTKPVGAKQLKNGLKTLGVKLPHGYEIVKRKRK